MASSPFGPAGTLSNPIIQQIAPTNFNGAYDNLLNQTNFEINTFKYPEDVGGQDVPSYVLFNIYMSDTSVYDKQHATSPAFLQSQSQQNIDFLHSKYGVALNAAGGAGPGAVGLIATTKALTTTAKGMLQSGMGEGLIQGAAAGVTAGATAGAVTLDAQTVSLRPILKRIATSVAIYMPDTVMTSFNHNYDTISATKAMGALNLAAAAGGSLSQAFDPAWRDAKNSFNDLMSADVHGAAVSGTKIFKDLGAGMEKLNRTPAGREVAGNIAQATGVVGSGFTELSLRSGGEALNPQIELIYHGTAFRSYMFEFRFQPRSAKESQTIKDIIQVFKYYSSPGIQPNSYGRYFTVPGQFDITFKFGNIENPFISKISTCILEAIDINYSGAGQFATFADGSPAEILLQLRFKEGEVLYRELMENPSNGSNNRGF
jgi:hypothetical protein